MGPGTSFHRVLWDLDLFEKNGQVRRMVLCSGKVYYDLLETKTERRADAVELIRVEQLYPFPGKALKEALARHPKAEVVCARRSRRTWAPGPTWRRAWRPCSRRLGGASPSAPCWAAGGGLTGDGPSAPP